MSASVSSSDKALDAISSILLHLLKLQEILRHRDVDQERPALICAIRSTSKTMKKLDTILIEFARKCLEVYKIRSR